MSGGASEPSSPAPGLWSWSRRHPEWHPGDFGAEVVSFLAVADGEALLIDPLLDVDDDPAWETIDTQVGDRLRVLITIPYHVRSAEAVRERYRSRAAISIHGHPACAQRLASTEDFAPLVPGKQLPAGVTAHPIGKPRRHETPLHLPSHDALVFGDAVAGTPSGPRMWSDKRVDEGVRRFYEERFAPSLMPLLELDFDRLLLTHGPSVMTGGHAALREALEAPPWYHRG
jgi:hypothetical protein